MLLFVNRICFHLTLFIKKVHYVYTFKCRFKSWNVVFFGNDDFSLVSLEELYKHLQERRLKKLEVVISNAYSNPVDEFAKRKNLKVHHWPPFFTDSYDLGVVVSFGKLIPKKLIDKFHLGVINVHASLLPQYRGATPIFHAIKNGDVITGITIMKIKPDKFDIGNILGQEICEIGKNELMPSLRKRLAILGATCLSNTIINLPKSLENSKPQSSDKVLSAPKFTKDLSIVQWDKMTAKEIYNLYRALQGKFDLKTKLQMIPIKLICISPNFYKQSSLFNSVGNLKPGSLQYCPKTHGLRVFCKDEPLYICSIRINHKIMVAFDFYRGYLQFKPEEEWIFT